MSPNYLIRLDDAHPCMNHKKWSYIENIFKEYDIKPLVAVIPNNKDQALNNGKFSKTFWEKVKKWQEKGWTIAMHGNKHEYNIIPANKSILPLHNRSEFSGLTYSQQASKILQATKIFKNHKIPIKVFVAPSHTFDDNTLKALKLNSDVKIISDGWSRRPFFQKGFLFIPQQLWTFRKKRTGVWTVCLHPDFMADSDFKILIENIKEFRQQIIGLEELNLNAESKRKFSDIIFHHSISFRLRLKRILQYKNYRR